MVIRSQLLRQNGRERHVRERQATAALLGLMTAVDDFREAVSLYCADPADESLRVTTLLEARNLNRLTLIVKRDVLARS